MSWEIIEGDCLRVLPTLEPVSFHAIIADPPYASGGLHATTKRQSVDKKYQQTGTKKTYPVFGGDSRDQLSMVAWHTLWISETMRLLAPGGYFFCFSDWRQINVVTTSMQCAEITWRGIIPWDKTQAARCVGQGWFRHQCEYVLWGSKGKPEGSTYPEGIYREYLPPKQKQHMTAKPVGLLRHLLSVVAAGGRVLDPFAGSGSAGAAAVDLGLGYVGIEQSPEYAEIARNRLASLQIRNKAE